jgi:hypothetical protein
VRERYQHCLRQEIELAQDNPVRLRVLRRATDRLLAQARLIRWPALIASFERDLARVDALLATAPGRPAAPRAA